MRPVKIVISPEANIVYRYLESSASKEMRSVFRSILRDIDVLKTNPDFGIELPKKDGYKRYMEKFGVNNLYKIELANYWRMLVSGRRTGSETTVMVLGIMDHPTYDKIFGFER